MGAGPGLDKVGMSRKVWHQFLDPLKEEVIGLGEKSDPGLVVLAVKFLEVRLEEHYLTQNIGAFKMILKSLPHF